MNTQPFDIQISYGLVLAWSGIVHNPNHAKMEPFKIWIFFDTMADIFFQFLMVSKKMAADLSKSPKNWTMQKTHWPLPFEYQTCLVFDQITNWSIDHKVKTS